MADPVSTAIFIGVQLAATAILASLQDPIEVGKLDEISGNIEGEGASLAVCYGEEAVTDGIPIMLSVREEEDVDSNLFGPDVTEYKYFASIAVAWCDTRTGPIDRVRKVWASENLIWDLDSTHTITSSNLTVEKKVIGGLFDETVAIIRSTDEDVDLSLFRPGRDKVTITGFSDSGNDGEKRVRRSGRTSQTDTFLRIKNSGAVTCAGSCGTVTITQDWENWSKRDVRYEPDHYTGTNAQNVDATIEGIVGAGEAPPYRGVCYSVFKDLKLKHFGNGIPKFRALLATSSAAVTVADVIDDLCERIELENQDRGLDGFTIKRDTSGVTSKTVRGFTLREPHALEALQNLSAVFNVAFQDTGAGGLRFFFREDATEVAVDTNDLAAHRSGDSYDRPFSGRAEKIENLPSEVSVRYFDPELGYARGSQREIRQHAEQINVKTVDAPFVLTAEEARGLAAKIVWLAEASQNIIRLSLPRKYIHVLENDVLTFTDADSHEWKLLVDRVDRSFEGALEFECIEEAASTLSFTRSASNRPFVLDRRGRIPIDPTIHLAVFEHGPMRHQDALAPTLYLAASVYDGDEEGVGATIFRSVDDGANFEPFAFFAAANVMGFSESTLADVPATAATWDEVSTVVVRLNNEDFPLLSATESEVLVNRVNWCRLGSEVIAFRTSTDNGDGTYTLSGLLRGLYNTSDQTGSHSASEDFVILASIATPIELNPADIGKTWRLKAVAGTPSEADPDDVDDYAEITIEGATIRPWAPGAILGVSADFSAASSGTAITWERRTRSPVTVFGAKPLLEPIERYRVQPLDGPGGNVLETYLINGRTLFNYSSVSQGLDGWSPGDWVRLAQWSVALNDWGDTAEGTAG